MIPFNNDIVELLNASFLKEKQCAELIQIAAFSFHIHFTGFQIQCEERVLGTINNTS